jgi:hypothetical protein
MDLTFFAVENFVVERTYPRSLSQFGLFSGFIIAWEW